jgi:hypothetical protein
MHHTKAEEFKQAIIRRAIELGMDPKQRATCSPGIKALAQIYLIILRYPHLLETCVDDLLVHDFSLLSSLHAPDKFIWTVRPNGSNLFYPDPESGAEFLFHMRTQPGGLAYTFDGNNLERILNLDYGARFLSNEQNALAA